MRAWHRTNKIFNKNNNFDINGIAKRMALCLEDAGPSITIRWREKYFLIYLNKLTSILYSPSKD